MTLNVWSGLDYKGTLMMGEYESPEIRERRYQAFLAEIRRLSPDVIGINEANFLPDYVERLARDLDFDIIHHVGVSGARIGRAGVPWNLREGDAILARRGLCLEFAGRKHLGGGGFVYNWASFHTDDATQVLVGSISAGWQQIFVAVTHLHASPEDSPAMLGKVKSLAAKLGRDEQETAQALAQLKADNDWRAGEVKSLLSYLSATVPKGAPIILLGDFNAVITSPEIRPLVEAGWTDAYGAVARDDGFTWDPARNMNIRKYYPGEPDDKHAGLYEYLCRHKETQRSRIDFIFLNNAFSASRVMESAVCADRVTGGVHPSDHFGVVSKISLAESFSDGKYRK
jgi:endonuclease/exonuclease/phosphatase family metal-dependent hydrolase